MADYDRKILDFYQLPTPYPSEWPSQKDDGEVSEDESFAKKANQRKSRYQALAKAVSERKSLVSGSDGGNGGVGTLVQTDEPDPLGSTDSVIGQLRNLGVPLQDDTRLRETTFCSIPFCGHDH